VTDRFDVAGVCVCACIPETVTAQKVIKNRNVRH